MPPISPDRWRLLSPYLDEALEIAEERRDAWLATISARDPVLAADLNRLLAEHAAVHRERFLDRSVLDPRTMLSQSLVGEVVGPYRLVSLIGQGGSGSVWLAERCDGRFEGRAAVKLLNLALVGRSGEDRFRREGTILARLRHPRIAHLIDAGVSRAGQPYLVLEHVDGQNIDRYCDDRALSIEARLRLFLDVLEAVAHAHANLIVHRDIKPANVLVSQDGQVKLLDFGIAKLVEGHAEWDPAGAVTREGARALTPEFAAPEQLSGGTVTTATDIYALGVLLYLLLTGQHPVGEALRSPATLVRAIVERDPERPSDAVAMAQATPDGVAHHAVRCGTTVGRLQRILRGDLDTIVAKTLKKDAAERYPSVTALADDIRRFLRHEPIGARADSLRYRTTQFVRRHARAVAATAATVLAVAALTALYTIRLSDERDRAQRETEKAVKVSELLMGVLTRADPYANRQTVGEPTARGLFDVATDQVRRDMDGQPELQAAMLTMMGRTYRRIGVFDTSRQVLEEALESGRRAFGPTHLQLAQTLHELAVLLSDVADYPAAAGRLEEALAMRRRLLAPAHPDIAVTLSELGRVYQDMGQYERAEPLAREALALRSQSLGESHQETAVSMSDLASVLRLKGDLAGAQALLEQSLEVNRKTRGEEHPNTSAAYHDLILVGIARGEIVGAESTLRRVLQRQRAALGAEHPATAPTLNTLGRVLATSRQLEEADAALQDAATVVRRALGPDHQLVAIYTANRAAIGLRRGDAATAEPLAREALRIRSLAPAIVPSRRRTVPADDWSVPAIRSLLGATLTAQGRFADAEAMLVEARRELEGSGIRNPSDLDLTHARLEDLYRVWGRSRTSPPQQP